MRTIHSPIRRSSISIVGNENFFALIAKNIIMTIRAPASFVKDPRIRSSPIRISPTVAIQNHAVSGRNVNPIFVAAPPTNQAIAVPAIALVMP